MNSPHLHPHHPHHQNNQHQQPPPNYGPVVVQHEQAGESIEGITVPLLLVFSFALFLVGATYMATTQFNSLANAVERLGGKIQDVADRINGRIDRLETDNAGNLSRQDHQLWCASAERANRNIGWACTEHPSPLTPPPAQPTVKGWRATLK